MDGAYIPMQEFKNTFFPGKRCDPEVDNESDIQRRMDQLAGSDNESVATESVAISTIMQGKTNQELAEARDMEVRR